MFFEATLIGVIKIAFKIAIVRICDGSGEYITKSENECSCMLIEKIRTFLVVWSKSARISQALTEKPPASVAAAALLRVLLTLV